MRGLAQAFDRGARRYDLLVSLNPGYHDHLDSAAAELLRRVGPRPAGLRLLDLACGSGASTRALLRASRNGPTVLGVDLSEGMLEQARAKRWPDGVRFLRGRCGALDVEGLGPGSWHGVFASYLFRNVPADGRDGALREAHELLAPGGWLVTQEYSVAGDRRAAATWDAVSWGVIVPLGVAIDRNPGLYRYLWRSVRDFDSTAALHDRLGRAGFTGVEQLAVTGWQRGILHTFLAQRPHRPTASR